MTGREGANQNRGFGCSHIPAEQALDIGTKRGGGQDSRTEAGIAGPSQVRSFKERGNNKGGQVGRSRPGDLGSKKPEKAVGSELLGNPGPEGLWAPKGLEVQGEEGPGVHPPETHPIPAPGGQPASISAEAAAAYRALVSPELSATRKVFCLLWQHQPLPRPQTHCEVLCVGNGERGRFLEKRK